VYTLALAGDKILAGGWFSQIAGQSRAGAAEIDKSSGQATPWNPKFQGQVIAISASDTALFVGGSFSSVASEGRPHLGEFRSPTGSVTVEVAPDTASWTLTGPAGFEGNGQTYTGDRTFAEAPVGVYTWTGMSMSGYSTPSSQTQTLSDSGTLLFEKVWQRQTGTISVHTSPGTATWTITGPDDFSANGASFQGDRTFSNAPVGSYTVQGHSITGYATPTAQTQSLEAGGTVTFTLTWTSSGGTGPVPGGCSGKAFGPAHISHETATSIPSADLAVFAGVTFVILAAKRKRTR